MEESVGESFKDLSIKNLDNINGLDCTDTSIGNIVTTNVGTIPGFPEFSSATNLLFNQLTSANIEAYSNVIRSMISKYEPRVEFKKLAVERHKFDPNTLIVTIDYTLRDSTETRKVAVDVTKQ